MAETETLHVAAPSELVDAMRARARRNYSSLSAEMRRAMAAHLSGEPTLARALAAEEEEEES